jgi:hypothetical protein
MRLRAPRKALAILASMSLTIPSMPESFPCPYLDAEVELTDERQDHIAHNHPDVLPSNLFRIPLTLADPDAVYRSPSRANTQLFTRWYDDFLGGKHLIVAVVTDPGTNRRWIVTTHPSGRRIRGELLWSRS